MYIFHAAVKDLPNTKFIKACYTQQKKIIMGLLNLIDKYFTQTICTDLHLLTSIINLTLFEGK